MPRDHVSNPFDLDEEISEFEGAATQAMTAVSFEHSSADDATPPSPVSASIIAGENQATVDLSANKIDDWLKNYEKEKHNLPEKELAQTPPTPLPAVSPVTPVPQNASLNFETGDLLPASRGLHTMVESPAVIQSAITAPRSTMAESPSVSSSPVAQKSPTPPLEASTPADLSLTVAEMGAFQMPEKREVETPEKSGPPKSVIMILVLLGVLCIVLVVLLAI